MIHALILAAAAHAAPPPSTAPLRPPPSAREAVELQLKATAPERAPALSAAEARRIYENYLEGLGRAPAGERVMGTSARGASAVR